MKKIYNCSINKENYSQRNNEIDPLNGCNVTAIVQALDYRGWKLPSHFNGFKQPEDDLHYFMLTDKRVLDFYKSKMPAMYEAWDKERMAQMDKGVKLIDCRYKNSNPPNEVHRVLEYGTNLWIGCDAVEFHDGVDISYINSKLMDGSPVVVSVKFGKLLGHILTIVGCECWDDHVINYIVDDTYGVYDFKEGKYKNISGNDCSIKYSDMIKSMKPLESNRKWAYFFNKPAAVN